MCVRVRACVCVCARVRGLDSYLAQVLICLIQVLSAIVAIRENLGVHIQCIYRFECFSCDGRIHGTWCVFVCTCFVCASKSTVGWRSILEACKLSTGSAAIPAHVSHHKAYLGCSITTIASGNGHLRSKVKAHSSHGAWRGGGVGGGGC